MASSLHLDDKGILVACTHCGQTNRVAFDTLGHTARCGAREQAEQLAKSAVPVVVDYWAPWCGPCRMVAPELEKVATRADGRYLVVKVNTDALSDLGQRYTIRSIPTMALFSKGREVTRTTGARPAADIEAFIAQALVAPH